MSAAARRNTAWRPVSMALACTLALSGALNTGCANRPKPLYEWGSYQTQVYAYFKAQEGPQAQLQALEADLEAIRAHGNTPPPGFHAHLGLLYSTLGNDDRAVQALLNEKALFPESSTYIDFLLAKTKKTKGSPS